MGRKFIDRTGERYERLEVKSRIIKNGKVFWKCKCDCGNEKDVASSNIGNVFSCGCIRTNNPNNRRMLPPGFAIRNMKLAEYKTDAKKRGLEWTLTVEEAFELFQGNCHYCGIKPCTTLKVNGCRGEFVYNGIDRKDSDIGYLPNNVVSCCKFCQYAKRSLPYDEFIVHLRRAGKFQLRLTPEDVQSDQLTGIW